MCHGRYGRNNRAILTYGEAVLMHSWRWLPTFELAARHLSFKRTAAELHLTPSAVSQQIQALEEALGVALFRRMTRALELTEAGAHLAAIATELVERYRREAGRLMRRRGEREVRLSAEPFIAHELLIPELAAFREVQPDVDLRIETGMAPVELDRDGVDTAVRYGRGPWPGVAATHLCAVIATPVCAPGLIKGDRLRTPAALARHTLIRLRDQPDPWRRLGDALGIELPAHRLVLDTYFATLRAAEKHQGIAIGLFPVTTSLVTDGRLVTPLPIRVRARAGFQFVCRPEDARAAAITGVRDWVRARFAALAPLPDAPAVATIDEP